MVKRILIYECDGCGCTEQILTGNPFDRKIIKHCVLSFNGRECKTDLCDECIERVNKGLKVLMDTYNFKEEIK